jgi:hypothetical protein
MSEPEKNLRSPCTEKEEKNKTNFKEIEARHF